MASSSDSEAVVWIDGVPSILKDYLRVHGVPNAFERWINTGEITGISQDGFILVGYGAAIGGYRGYVVVLKRMEPKPWPDLICALAALMCLAAPSEVCAQVWQGSALFGMTPGSALDRRAAALDSLDVGGGFTWGLQVSRLVTPHVAAELSWMTHWSGLEIGTAAGKEHLFEMTVNQLHGNVVFRLLDPAARTRPFLFAGLGTTFLNALGQPAESQAVVRSGWRCRGFLLEVGRTARAVPV